MAKSLWCRDKEGAEGKNQKDRETWGKLEKKKINSGGKLRDKKKG